MQQAIPVDSLQFVYLRFRTCSQLPNFTTHALSDFVFLDFVFMRVCIRVRGLHLAFFGFGEESNEA